MLALSLCEVPFLLFAMAEQHVSSGLASILNATTPLMTMLVTVLALRQEKLTAARVSGLLLGFLGVVTLTGPWQGGGGGSLLAELACVCATLCYGIGFPYTRRYLASRSDSGLALSAGQLVCATCLLLLPIPLLRRVSRAKVSGTVSGMCSSALISRSYCVCSVVNTVPSPRARAASSRFWTAG